MTNLRPVSSSRGDERGQTLPMLLIALTLITVVFTAVMTYQRAAMTAQTTLKDNRRLTLAADDAIDDAISQLQIDRTKGCIVAASPAPCSSSGGCNSTSPGLLTSSPWIEPAINPAANNPAVSVDVYCNTFSGSGSFSTRGTTIAASLVPSVMLTGVSTATATDQLAKTAHGLTNGNGVVLSGVSNTKNISNGVLYFVVSATPDSFKVASTPGGSPIDLQGTDDSNSITAVKALAVANVTLYDPLVTTAPSIASITSWARTGFGTG